MRYAAMSVVKPAGRQIALREKTIEVRRWRPDKVPLQDLLIVENDRPLLLEGDKDPSGRAVALVDVEAVTPWTRDLFSPARATTWEPGLLAWHLVNIRPVSCPDPVLAARKIYPVEVRLVPFFPPGSGTYG